MKPDRRNWEYVPIGVASAAAATAVGYVRLMSAEGNTPSAPFLALLAIATPLAGCAAVRSVPHRAAALTGSGAILVGLGIIGMFSVGLPILIAGLVALAYARRLQRVPANPRLSSSPRRRHDGGNH